MYREPAKGDVCCLTRIRRGQIKYYKFEMQKKKIKPKNSLGNEHWLEISSAQSVKK